MRRSQNHSLETIDQSTSTLIISIKSLILKYLPSLIDGHRNENYIPIEGRMRVCIYTTKDHIYKALLYEVIDERTFTYDVGIGTDPALRCTVAFARCQESRS